MFMALLVVGGFALVIGAYEICVTLAIRGIRENALLIGARRVVRIGRITHRVEGEEVCPCDYIYMIYYDNGRKRRLVEASDSRFSKRLNEMAA